MADVLAFFVVVAISLIDPITLVAAALLAGIMSDTRLVRHRWLAVFLGAAVMTALLAALSKQLGRMEGFASPFPYVAKFTASAIQIWALTIGFRAARHHKKHDRLENAGPPTGDIPAPANTQPDSAPAAPQSRPRSPPVLYFKSGHAAFEYMLEYGRLEPLVTGCVRLALVEPDDMHRSEDGFQFVWVRVADHRGWFAARAVTAAPNVPPLKGGELVSWFAVKREPRLANVDRVANDPRSWWQAWIIAVLAPELIVATGALRTEIDYGEFAAPTPRP